VTLYDILGVSADATPEAIKLAFRKLANVHHPDKGGDQDRFQNIQFAYEVLSDPNRRGNYDSSGSTDDPAEVQRLRDERDVLSILREIVDSSINHPELDPEVMDAKQPAVARVQQVIVEFHQERARTARKAAKARELHSRYKTVEAGAESPILGLLAGRITEFERIQESIDRAIRLHYRVIEILDQHIYLVN
jgi:curved DNA-binding protein CbpA